MYARFRSLSHISILNFTYKPLDARFHLCLCRFEYDEDGLEVETQWVRARSSHFSYRYSSLKVDFQGSRVTSDGGLILVRELDERLGFSELIEQHLTGSRGKNTQLPLADLLRQSVYSRLAGYEDMNDAARVSQDPTFRLIGSEKIWERGAALTSRLQSFETEVLARDENLAGLAATNRGMPHWRVGQESSGRAW